MIRYRALLIAADYPDADDCDAFRDDSAFKMAAGQVGRPRRVPRAAHNLPWAASRTCLSRPGSSG